MPSTPLTTTTLSLPLLLFLLLTLASPTTAFGAGYVSRGSSAQGINYRHGDILASVYFLQHVHKTHIRQIYFGNWLRDFSQLIDRKAIELIPEPILRAVVAVFAHVQFGYSTGEFEVTTERLGCYRPEEHIDNPKGYEGAAHPAAASGSAAAAARGSMDSSSMIDPRYAQLRGPTTDVELAIQDKIGMKNYVANRAAMPGIETAYDFIEKQLVAAVACGRARNSEAYLHLGAALHTLEDFIAHSNWLELSLQMLGNESRDHSPLAEELKSVFAWTGGGARVLTKRGEASPLVTGTFGALDLYQTLLGEVDDKLSALSFPGLSIRMKGPEDSLSTATSALTALLKGAGGGDLIEEITNLSNNNDTSDPADWGKLNETPTLLWDLLKPILRIRDKIAQWVYDHLMIDAVANALAAISAAIDKVVYMALGLVLNPVLKDISAILAKQSADLLVKDQAARRVPDSVNDASTGSADHNIFSDTSSASDPTHSQLCKDHYGHPLNSLAGLVAVKVTTATIKKIVEIWQPGSIRPVKPVVDEILETLHHPWNYSMESDLQGLMVGQVYSWVGLSARRDEFALRQLLEGLDRERQAARNGLESGCFGVHQTASGGVASQEERLQRDGHHGSVGTAAGVGSGVGSAGPGVGGGDGQQNIAAQSSQPDYGSGYSATSPTSAEHTVIGGSSTGDAVHHLSSTGQGVTAIRHEGVATGATGHASAGSSESDTTRWAEDLMGRSGIGGTTTTGRTTAHHLTTTTPSTATSGYRSDQHSNLTGTSPAQSGASGLTPVPESRSTGAAGGYTSQDPTSTSTSQPSASFGNTPSTTTQTPRPAPIDPSANQPLPSATEPNTTTSPSTSTQQQQQQPARPPAALTEILTRNISRALSLRSSDDDDNEPTSPTSPTSRSGGGSMASRLKSISLPGKRKSSLSTSDTNTPHSPSTTSKDFNPETDTDSLLQKLKEAFETQPSGDTPNPIDHALALLPPGLVPLTTVFEGVENDEILGAEGVGVLLKDGVLMMRANDVELVERNQKSAHRKAHAATGGQDELSVKEILKLLDLKCHSTTAGGSAKDHASDPGKARHGVGAGNTGGGLRQSAEGGGGGGGEGDLSRRETVGSEESAGAGGGEGEAGSGGSGGGNKMGKLMSRLSISRSKE